MSSPSWSIDIHCLANSVSSQLVTGSPMVFPMEIGAMAPGYINLGRVEDLGSADPAERSVEAMQRRAWEVLDEAWRLGLRYFEPWKRAKVAKVEIGDGTKLYRAVVELMFFDAHGILMRFWWDSNALWDFHGIYDQEWAWWWHLMVDLVIAGFHQAFYGEIMVRKTGDRWPNTIRGNLGVKI